MGIIGNFKKYFSILKNIKLPLTLSAESENKTWKRCDKKNTVLSLINRFLTSNLWIPSVPLRCQVHIKHCGWIQVI